MPTFKSGKGATLVSGTTNFPLVEFSGADGDVQAQKFVNSQTNGGTVIDGGPKGEATLSFTLDIDSSADPYASTPNLKSGQVLTSIVAKESTGGLAHTFANFLILTSKRGTQISGKPSLTVTGCSSTSDYTTA